MTLRQRTFASGIPPCLTRHSSHESKISLDNKQELCKLTVDLTTVYPLTVVYRMVEPGVPPNAGLFLSRTAYLTYD
jgi:hypothetical protein